MANICRTVGRIEGPEEELKALKKEYETIKSLYGDTGENSIFQADIVRYYDMRGKGISFSGDLYMGRIENGSLFFAADTKYVAMLEVLILLRDKCAPRCRIIYTAAEPMLGYFESNDPETAGKYVLYSWEDIDDLPPITFDTPTSEENLYEWLKKAFGEGEFEELLHKLKSEYPVQVGYCHGTDVL